MEQTKPYRPNVGIALFNAADACLIAKRFKTAGRNHPARFRIADAQGGIDEGEDPRPARSASFRRDRVTSVQYLGETPDWLTYEFPPYAARASARCVSRPAAEVVRVPLLWQRARNRGDAPRNGRSPSSTHGAGEARARARVGGCRSGARFMRRARSFVRFAA